MSAVEVAGSGDADLLNSAAEKHVNGTDDDVEEVHDEAGETEEDEEDLEAIRASVQKLEAEAERLKQLQEDILQSQTATSPGPQPLGPDGKPLPTYEEKMETDARSIYVGNVDYGATAEELEAHFHGCGAVNRVTIQCDKFTGHPKGFGYIEFADKESIDTAMALDESLFRGRQIKVVAKRTNQPGISTTNRTPYGRGMRGRRGRGRFMGGFRPRRGGFRGRGRGFFPY